MPKPPAGAAFDLWILSISRAEIEQQNIVPAILELAPLLTSENVKRFYRKIALVVDGYDDDPRNLYAIDEVRSWVQLMDIAFPFWFYFLTLDAESSLCWIPFCLCRFRKVENGSIIDESDLKPFIARHAWALAQLCAVHSVPEKQAGQAIAEVYSFFGLHERSGT